MYDKMASGGARDYKEYSYRAPDSEEHQKFKGPVYIYTL